ncbi:MAG TPA: type II toxin-antitoxin system RelE/ParE family toxin [Candidatus Paceibacterota bacterium]
MRVFLTPQFVRMFDKLEHGLQEEAVERIETFKDTSSHRALRVHKLHGKHKNYYAFSVNYRYRIVFKYSSAEKTEAILLAVGDHDLYR